MKRTDSVLAAIGLLALATIVALSARHARFPVMGPHVRGMGGVEGANEIAGPVFVMGLDLSPDEKCLLVNVQGRKDSATVEPLTCSLGGDGSLDGLEFKPVKTGNSFVAETRFGPLGRGFLIRQIQRGSTGLQWVESGEVEKSPLDFAIAECDSFDISADGRLLAQSVKSSIIVCDIPARRHLFDLRDAGATCAICSLRFSPDGRRIISGGSDGSIRIWDVETRRQVFQMNGHGATISVVAFLPDGDRIASVSFDGTVRLWNGATGAEIWCGMADEFGVQAMAVSADGRFAATGGFGRRIIVWDLESHLPACEMHGHTQAVSALTFCTKGRTLISGSKDGTLRFWDRSSGAELKRVDFNTVLASQ